MKKQIFAVIAAIMVLTMGTTVFAAASPEDEAGYSEAEKKAVGAIDMGCTQAVDAKGNAIGLTVTPVSDTKYIATNSVAQTTAENALKNGLIKLSLKENQTPKADVLGVVEVKAPEETSYPVTITIPVGGVKAGDTVLLLHYVGNGWESVVPSVVGDGYVKGVFRSFSPVAVVLVEAADSTPSGSDNVNSDSVKEETTETTITVTNKIVNTTETTDNYYEEEKDTTVAGSTAPKSAKGGEKAVTSPKTGKPVSMQLYIAAICAAGILVCGYQVKKNK